MLLPVLFAVSGLICWCGISQVISNSVSSAFENAFHIPPLYSTIALVALAAVIVLRKNATVKGLLDVMVPVMAGCYLLITVVLIVLNFKTLPSVFARIFQEAFGIRQVVAGGFGAVLMNGVKRGLFSNEAGSGSAPCAAATAETDHPAKVGLGQALGVFIEDPDLYLYGYDHASYTGKHDKWTWRNGSSSGCNGLLHPWEPLGLSLLL